MHLKSLLTPITKAGLGSFVQVYNKHRYEIVCFDSMKQIVQCDSTGIVALPCFPDTKLSIKQADLLAIELLRNCSRSGNIDALQPEPKNMKKLFDSLVFDLQNNWREPFTKIAVLGNRLNRFQTVFQEMLNKFEYVDIIEHPAFSNDIVFIPVGTAIGYYVTDARRKRILGMGIYENAVKRLSFYDDNQLSKWLEGCTQLLKDDQ